MRRHVVGDDVLAPYSGDLRDRVAAGGSARSAAGRFGVSVSTKIRWAQRRRAEGHAQPRAMRGDRGSRFLEHRTAVVELGAQKPDLTLWEIRGALAAGHGISVGLTKRRAFIRRQPARPRAPGLHRRNLGGHQHDPPPWPSRPWVAAPGVGGHWQVGTLVAGCAAAASPRRAGLTAPSMASAFAPLSSRC
jgi:transposase